MSGDDAYKGRVALPKCKTCDGKSGHETSICGKCRGVVWAPKYKKEVQALTTRTESEHFSEHDEYYFASRVCCLLSSHSLPDDLHVVPAEFLTIIPPSIACSMSTASRVASGAVADTGNDRGVTNNLERFVVFF